MPTSLDLSEAEFTDLLGTDRRQVERPDGYAPEVPMAEMLERLTGSTNELLVCLG